MMDFHILPECYIDTNLAETLVPPSKKNYGYNHQKGCPTVAKKMQEEKGLKESFAVGIIDKDKKEIDYFKKFDEISSFDNLKIFKHPHKNHYFIQIIPAIEKWILANAEEVNIDLADFGLPSDFENLKKISKKITSKHDPKFKKLFQNLVDKKATGFIILKKWLEYLKKHPFDADINYFKYHSDDGLELFL